MFVFFVPPLNALMPDQTVKLNGQLCNVSESSRRFCLPFKMVLFSNSQSKNSNSFEILFVVRAEALLAKRNGTKMGGRTLSWWERSGASASSSSSPPPPPPPSLPSSPLLLPVLLGVCSDMAVIKRSMLMLHLRQGLITDLSMCC